MDTSLANFMQRKFEIIRMDFDLCKAFGLEFIEMFINTIIFKL